MKCSFIQTKSNICAKYQCLNENEILYSAEIPINFRGLKASILHDNEVIYTISFDRIDSFKKVKKDRLLEKITPYNIYDINNNLVGSICLRRTKFFNGYMYYEFILNNEKYIMYEIGLGKEGIKVPIYKNDMQVALIEKDIVVYDNKDTYEIIAIDNRSLVVSVLFNLYYDFIRFGNYGEINYKTKEKYYLYTLKKELKSKYDSNFKNIYI